MFTNKSEALGVILFAGALCVPGAFAQPTTCSQGFVSGWYGSQTSSVLSTGSLLGPVVGFGRLRFEENGTISGTMAQGSNGAIVQNALVGNFTVSNDCTVSIFLMDANGSSRTFKGIVTRGGDQILFVQTNQGSTVTGVLRRSRNYCSNSDMLGSYGYELTGDQLVPNPNSNSGSSVVATSTASIGSVYADGNGRLRGMTFANINGNIQQIAVFGTYTVNTDCSVTVNLGPETDAMGQSLTPNYSPFTLRGSLVDDGRSLLLTQTSAGIGMNSTFELQ